jgi:hypothetical protein
LLLAVDFTFAFKADRPVFKSTLSVGGTGQMLLPRLAASFALICLVSTAALAVDKGPTLRDRQQAACYGDAQKLCGDFIPDVDKVTTCMTAKRSQISAGCAKYFDADKAAQ